MNTASKIPDPHQSNSQHASVKGDLQPTHAGDAHNDSSAHHPNQHTEVATAFDNLIFAYISKFYFYLKELFTGEAVNPNPTSHDDSRGTLPEGKDAQDEPHHTKDDSAAGIAQNEEVKKGIKELTLEDIKNMESAAAGESGSSGAGFTVIGFGSEGYVLSIPRDLLIGFFTSLNDHKYQPLPTLDNIQTPQAAPVGPEANNDGDGDLPGPDDTPNTPDDIPGKFYKVFESGLPIDNQLNIGSDLDVNNQGVPHPNLNPHPHIVFGNILENDYLGSPIGTIKSIDYIDQNSHLLTTVVPDANGIINVFTENHGELLLFTKTLHNVDLVFNGQTITLDVEPGDFAYILFDNDPHSQSGADSIKDIFHYTIENPGGSASATLTIQIVDDVPIAYNDVNGTANEYGPLILSGNVVTGENDINIPPGADVKGADGTSMAYVQIGDYHSAGAGAPVSLSSNPAGILLQGIYGRIIFHNDGSYTYTLDPNLQAFKDLHGGGTANDVFSYTLIDSDGDIASATLTILIKNADDGVHITDLTPKIDGGDAAVNEKFLLDSRGVGESAGSHHGEVPPVNENGMGTFTISAPDGVGNLNIEGHAIIVNDAFSAVSFTTLLGNTLDITGYNPITGVVSYTYTLNDNESHSSVQGPNNIFEDFNITLTDSDGDTTSGTLSVRIIDDVATAVDDSNGTAATVLSPVLTGNLINNDTQGADGAHVNPTTIPLIGTYGTLVIHNDNTYTYTLTPNAAFSALPDGVPGSEDFVYTLTDADGDTSTAHIRLDVINYGVTIENLTPQLEGGDGVVNEDDLLASRGSGESAGSDPVKESTTVAGDFKITAPDGVALLTVGGALNQVIVNGVFNALSFTTPLGSTLHFTGYNSLTGLVTYEYTLNDNQAHPASGGANSIFENFSVALIDTDGNNANASLDVRIIDDVPSIDVSTVANPNPSLSVDETNLAIDDTLNFNNLFISTNVPGADGAASLVTAYSFNLTLANGSASGLLHDTASGTEGVFLYQVDATHIEGRLASGGVVFSLSLNAVSGDVTLDQRIALHHPDPTQPDEAVTLSNNGLIQLVRTDTITDNDGDVAQDSAAIPIGQALHFHDDVPHAYDNCYSVLKPALPSYNLVFILDVSGSMNDIVGAGGLTRLQVVKNALTGSGGLLDSYHDAAQELHITIVTFSSSAQLLTSTPIIVANGAAGDAALASAYSIINGLTAGGITNYASAITLGNTQINATTTTGFDNLVYFMSDGTPNPASSGVRDGGPNDALYDTWHNTLDGTNTDAVIVNIAPPNTNADPDMAPLDDNVANPEVFNVGANLSGLQDLLVSTIPTAASVTGNIILDAGPNPIPNVDTTGADAPIHVTKIQFAFADDASANAYLSSLPGSLGAYLDSSTHSIVIPIALTGTTTFNTPAGQELIFSSNGAFTYNINSLAPAGEEVFTYTIVDKDGDPSSAHVCLDIQAPPTVNPDTLDISGHLIKVFEAGLPAGSGVHPTNAMDPIVVQGNIFSNDSLGTNPSIINIIYNHGSVLTPTAVDAYHNLYTTPNGTLLLNVDPNSANFGDFTYTLINAHNDPGAGNNIYNEIFTYTVTNDTGLHASADLTVQVVDDIPSIDVNTTNAIEPQLNVYDRGLPSTDVNDGSDANTFANLFTATTIPGADGLHSGDGHTISYSLSKPAGNPDSGIDALNPSTHTYQSVFLYQVDATHIEGRIASGTIVAFSLSVDANTGAVTLTQNLAMDHSTGSTISLAGSGINMVRSDTVIDNDGDTATDSASKTIGQDLFFHDDTPIAYNRTYDVNVPSVLPSYNLVFTIDVSGSMGPRTDFGGGYISTSPNKTKLDLAKEAVKVLIDKYGDASANLTITIITFNGSLSKNGVKYDTNIDQQPLGHISGYSYPTFSSVGAAIDYLKTISTNNSAPNTHYDSGVEAATAAVNQIVAANPSYITQSYFMSDGEPNPNSTRVTPTKNGSIYQAWQNALEQNPTVDSDDVHQYVFNIATPDKQNNVQAYLIPLAKQSVYQSSGIYTGTYETTPYLVTITSNLNNLPAILESTVPSAASVEGNLITNIPIDSLQNAADSSGADAPASLILTEISFALANNTAANNYLNNTLHVYNPTVSASVSGNVVTINVASPGTTTFQTPLGKTMEIEANGNFIYNTSSPSGDTFTYKIQDADGSSATGTVSMNVNSILNIRSSVTDDTGDYLMNGQTFQIVDSALSANVIATPAQAVVDNTVANSDIATATIHSTYHDNLLSNDVLGSAGAKIVEISFNTANAAEFIADNMLNGLGASADADGHTVHIPLSDHQQNVTFITPLGATFEINQSGDIIYDSGTTQTAGAEHFIYSLQDIATGEIHHATLEMNVVAPSDLVALVGTNGHDVMNSNQHYGTAPTVLSMRGHGGGDTYIIDESDAHAPHKIIIEDLGLSQKNILEFTGVTSNGATPSLHDAVTGFEQDGTNISLILHNNSTVVLQNVGAVAGVALGTLSHNIDELDHHLQAITAQLNVHK